MKLVTYKGPTDPENTTTTLYVEGERFDVDVEREVSNAVASKLEALDGYDFSIKDGGGGRASAAPDQTQED